jgi:hypothetical protein
VATAAAHKGLELAYRVDEEVLTTPEVWRHRPGPGHLQTAQDISQLPIR